MSEPGTLPDAPSTVVAVLVAYNRRDLLIEALDALAAQDRPVADILVVNDASTDDSAGVARAHATGPTVLDLAQNTGGAGGFAAGIAYVLESMNADSVWLMDDDTIVCPDPRSDPRSGTYALHIGGGPL